MRVTGVLAAVFVGGGVLASPAGLPRATPESQGVPTSAISDFLRTFRDGKGELNAFAVLRHGNVIAEAAWAPFDVKTPQPLNEASGGIVAMAVALAVRDGVLILDDHVGWTLPGSVPPRADDLQRDMRVRDLLGMSSGIREDAFASMLKADPVRSFMASPMETVPGRAFRYFRANDAMLVQILARATRERNLASYLQRRLFEPLGIRTPVWRTFAANGTALGSGGLALPLEDFAKLAELLRQGGRWNGRQVLPVWFVPQATTCQTPYGKVLDPVLRHQVGVTGLFDSSADFVDWRSGYGFGLWLGADGSYRMSGARGQLAVVWPQHDLVLVTYAAGEGANAQILSAFRATVLAQLKDAALPDDATARQALARTCGALTRARPMSPGGGSAVPTDVAKARAAAGCAMEGHKAGVSRFKYDPAAGVCKFENDFGIQEFRVKTDGTWTPGCVQLEAEGSTEDPLYAVPGGAQQVAAAGAWVSSEVFKVRVVFRSASLDLSLTLDCSREPARVSWSSPQMPRYEYPAR